MSSRRAVLVTGAGRGIGLATTRLLAGRGHCVFAGLRRPDALGDGLAELVDRLPGAVVPLRVEMTDPATHEAAAELVAERAGALHALVNNAGYAAPAPLEFLPLDQLRAQLEVNLVGHLGVTQAVLPLLRATRGRIVNVSSIGGLVAGPVLGAYHMSKFAMEAMTDTLRRELRHHGVGVTAIEPGAVDTDIWATGLAHAEQIPPEAAGLYGHLMERAAADARSANQRGSSPDVVAATILEVLTTRRPPARRTVGRDARIGRIVGRLPAALVDGLIAR